MTVELAVLGAPFLDVTFEGLPRIPGVGEEVVAEDVHIAVGGTGMQAVAAARLGLTTALVAPLGTRGPGGLLRTMLEEEGVHLPAPNQDHPAPTTALLATPDGVAMTTALAHSEPAAHDVAAVTPASVLVSLGRLGLVPHGASIYAVTGALELDHVDERTLRRLAHARALILNATEAARLTGIGDPEDAARELAGRGPAAIVTLGAEGSVAWEGDNGYRTSAPRVDVVDATGAGDLFAAAYVWADVRGTTLEERIAWAALYAGLSVRAPTAFAGALDLMQLLTEGRERGLRPPRALSL